MIDATRLATRGQGRPGSSQAIPLVDSGDSWVTDSRQSLHPPAPICNPIAGKFRWP